MNVIDMYLKEISKHSLAAQKALKLKDLEKAGKRFKSSGGFKAVVPKIKKKSKLKDIFRR